MTAKQFIDYVHTQRRDSDLRYVEPINTGYFAEERFRHIEDALASILRSLEKSEPVAPQAPLSSPFSSDGNPPDPPDPPPTVEALRAGLWDDISDRDRMNWIEQHPLLMRRHYAGLSGGRGLVRDIVDQHIIKEREERKGTTS